MAKIDEKREYIDYANRLMDLVSNGASFGEMATVISRKIGNPVLIVDRNFKALALSETKKNETNPWDGFLDHGYCSFAFISEFRSHVRDYLNNASQALILMTISSGAKIAVTKLYLQYHYGYILILEQDAKIDDRMFQLIEVSGKVGSFMASLGERKALMVRYSYADHIILECLSGEFHTREAFEERLNQAGLSFPGTYRCIVADVSKYYDFDPKKDVLRDLFAKCIPKSWTVWFGDSVVCLAEAQESAGQFLECLRKEERDFGRINVRIGISDEFTDVYAITKYYQQAGAALSFAETMSANSIFSFYDSFKFIAMASNSLVNGRTPLRSYCSELFLKVREYDEKNQTVYAETIFQYLLSGESLQKTAEAMYVHRNTIGYRLNKAKELFDIDYHDVFVSVSFIQSYWIWQAETKLTTYQ